MQNSLKVEQFWNKLMYKLNEIHRDFNDLDAQEKQIIESRVVALLQAKGIAISAEALRNAMRNFKSF